MSERTHEALVAGQFGSRAEAYLNSAVHAQSPDLDALVTLMKEQPQLRVLDLGCGGGHVTFNVAPLVREVVAYDLSPEMLALVARAAKERGLDNVTTQQGAGETCPTRTPASTSSSAASAPITGATSTPACARRHGS